VQLELNLARDAKHNKKSFYRYVSKKSRVKTSLPTSPMSKTGNLISTDEKKAEGLKKFLPQSSLATSLPTPIEWINGKMGTGGAKSLPL